jgi:hypothetical protein
MWLKIRDPSLALGMTNVSQFRIATQSRRGGGQRWGLGRFERLERFEQVRLSIDTVSSFFL